MRPASKSLPMSVALVALLAAFGPLAATAATVGNQAAENAGLAPTSDAVRKAIEASLSPAFSLGQADVSQAVSGVLPRGTEGAAAETLLQANGFALESTGTDPSDATNLRYYSAEIAKSWYTPYGRHAIIALSLVDGAVTDVRATVINSPKPPALPAPVSLSADLAAARQAKEAEARFLGTRPDPDLSAFVAPYFPTGTPIYQAEELLRAEGFDFKRIAAAKDDPTRVDFTGKRSEPGCALLCPTYHVELATDGAKVMSAKSWIVSRVLP